MTTQRMATVADVQGIQVGGLALDHCHRLRPVSQVAHRSPGYGGKWFVVFTVNAGNGVSVQRTLVEGVPDYFPVA